MNTPIPVSSFESNTNKLKRKSSEENEYENFLSNEMLKGRSENKDLQASKTLANYDMNCYSQDQSQDISILSPQNPSLIFRSLLNYASPKRTYSYETKLRKMQKVP